MRETLDKVIDHHVTSLSSLSSHHHLILYSTSPLGWILTYRFGVRISWNLPIFSFLKKLSGCQIFRTSVSVKYLILSVTDSIQSSDPAPCPRYLLHSCYPAFLWTPVGDRSTSVSELFGICTPVITRTDKHTLTYGRYTILTSLISENPRTKMLTKTSVAASENEKVIMLHGRGESGKNVV